MSSRVTDAVTGPQWKTYRGEKPKTVKIRVIGKVGIHWLAFRRQWMRDHKPDWAGNYICTDCGIPVHRDSLTLDHRERRGSHPDKRFDETNIVPLCGPCHVNKDSGMRII